MLDINLRARKNFVIGRTTAAVSLEGFDLSQKKAISGPIQIDGKRQFGRRFQIGFQIAF